MKPKTDLAPDWGQLLDDLETAGMKPKDVAEACGLTMMSKRMVQSLRQGIQPAFWRGDAIIKLWCSTLKRDRETVPMAEVQRNRWGKRMRAAADRSPKVVNLPQWPALAVKPVTRQKRQKVAA